MKVMALGAAMRLVVWTALIGSGAAEVWAVEEPQDATATAPPAAAAPAKIHAPAKSQELTEPTPEQVAELEKLMSGSTLVGHFTVTGVEMRGELPKERYELGEVKRLESGDWLIQARIRYGQHDVALPLTLPIRWAGDTPVICVDEMAFPGLGTYTARVMIYRGHYAGFWTGKEHGGHLFGVVEPAKTE